MMKLAAEYPEDTKGLPEELDVAFNMIDAIVYSTTLHAVVDQETASLRLPCCAVAVLRGGKRLWVQLLGFLRSRPPLHTVVARRPGIPPARGRGAAIRRVWRSKFRSVSALKRSEGEPHSSET